MALGLAKTLRSVLRVDPEDEVGFTFSRGTRLHAYAHTCVLFDRQQG
jgi:hypothetical protein